MRVWRPVRARRVAIGLAAVVAFGGVALARALPGHGEPSFSAPDRVALALLGCAVAGVILLLARPRLAMYDDGLLVVNLLRRRRLHWAEVVAVQLGRDDSWASLDVSDGTALPVMALQVADGQRTAAAVRELRATLAAGTGPASGRGQR